MRDFIPAFATVAAVALIIGAAGCSQDTGGGAEEDSPEFAAMRYRQSLMQVQAFKLGVLRDMAEGVIDADADVFEEYAADLAAVTGMLLDGFDGLEGSSAEALQGTRALPDIWANWDDFVQKQSDLQAAAEEVAAAASAPGFSVGADSAAPLGPACGGCHRVYRQQ